MAKAGIQRQKNLKGNSTETGVQKKSTKEVQSQGLRQN
jgi:hypothetical protein